TLTDDQASAVDLSCRERWADTGSAEGAIEAQRFARSERRRGRRPARILATDSERDPGPRVKRLDRRVGAERQDRPGRRERAPRVATGFGSRPPHHPCPDPRPPATDPL